MSDAFPPPTGQPGDYASVVPANRPAPPQRRWTKGPLWALIAVPVLGLGALVAVRDRKTDDNRTVAGVTSGSSIVIATTPAETEPPTTVALASPGTTAAPTSPTASPGVGPTAAPTTQAATPPTAAAVRPTPTPTVAPGLAAIPAPAVSPSSAPGVSPIPVPSAHPPAPPTTLAPAVIPTPTPAPAPNVPPPADPTVPPPTDPTVPPAPAPTDPPPSAEPSSGCNPNYEPSPCVPNDPVDVDCAGGGGNGPSYVSGPVTVIGNDGYDLDSDGDGVACVG